MCGKTVKGFTFAYYHVAEIVIYDFIFSFSCGDYCYLSIFLLNQ